MFAGIRRRYKVVKRMCGNTICKPGGCCRRTFSVQLWGQRCTSWLSRLVNRRSVMLFTIAETFVALWSIVFYFCFDKVVNVIGWSLLATPVVPLALSVFRFVSGVLGIVAAWGKYVSRMRLYWVLMFINLALSIEVMLVIWSCDCECEYEHGVWVDKAQCEALKSYQWLLDGGESQDCNSPEQSRRLSDRSLLPRWRPQARSSPQSKTDREQLDELMLEFIATDTGITYSHDRDPVDLGGQCNNPAMLANEAQMSFDAGLRILQCKWAPWELADDVVLFMIKVLTECQQNPLCSIVEYTVELPLNPGVTGSIHTVCGLKQPAIPQLDSEALRVAARCARSRPYRNCSSEKPKNLPPECSSFKLHMSKIDETPVVDIIPDEVKRYCTIINVVTLFVLIALTIIAVPFLAVIFMFIQERCGDVFHINAQFEVEFTDSRAEFDDDFEVGTWISRQERSIGGPTFSKITTLSCQSSRLDIGGMRSGRDVSDTPLSNYSDYTQYHTQFSNFPPLSTLDSGDSHSFHISPMRIHRGSLGGRARSHSPRLSR